MTTEKKPAPLEEWQRDAIAAEPRGFMQDIIQASRQRSQSASLIPDRQRVEEKPRPPDGGGTVPIEPAPGIAHLDRIAESFARADRAAAARVRIDNELAEAMMKNKAQNKAKTEYDPAQRFDDETPSFHRKKK